MQSITNLVEPLRRWGEFDLYLMAAARTFGNASHDPLRSLAAADAGLEHALSTAGLPPDHVTQRVHASLAIDESESSLLQVRGKSRRFPAVVGKHHLTIPCTLPGEQLH